MIYVAIAIGSLGGIANPAMQSVMSQAGRALRAGRAAGRGRQPQRRRRRDLAPGHDPAVQLLLRARRAAAVPRCAVPRLRGAGVPAACSSRCEPCHEWCRVWVLGERNGVSPRFLANGVRPRRLRTRRSASLTPFARVRNPENPRPAPLSTARASRRCRRRCRRRSARPASA